MMASFIKPDVVRFHDPRFASPSRKMPHSNANTATPAQKAAEKQQMSLPWDRSSTQQPPQNAPTPSKSPKAIDIYYLDGDNKISLGTANDKITFAPFSSTVKSAAKGEHLNGQPEEVVLQNVDNEAASLILRWINENNMHASKPLIFDVPATLSFGFLCKLHRATYVFRVRREFRGNKMRELLVEYIGGLKQPSLRDFELAEEELGFDPPLIYLMRSQVCSVHLVSGLAEGEYERILGYCGVQGERLTEEMRAIEAEIRLSLEDGKVGLEGETSFVVNKSVDYETFAASLSKEPVAKREKVRLGSRNVGENKSEEAKAREAKPSQAVAVTKVGKVSYADALKH
jgi:hypothetical protein